MLARSPLNYLRLVIRRCGGVVCVALISTAACESTLAQTSGNGHIQFNTPSGYLQGYVDYLNYLAGATNDGNSQFFRLADDIDEGKIPGTIIVVDPHSGSLTTLTDFDDLHTFNIGFDQVSTGEIPYSGAIDVVDVIWLGGDEEDETVVHSLADWQAAEALRISDWQQTGIDRGARPSDGGLGPGDPNPAPQRSPVRVRGKRNGLGMIYGLRMIERDDWQSLNATGGILGSMHSATVADNHIMGPTLGMIWIKTRGRWTARLQGLLSVGFNSGEVDQNNLVGSELIPGATNRLLYGQRTASTHHDSFDEFSPSGELRAEANYRITDALTFAISWSGVAIDNALEAENRTVYYLPDFGLADPGNQRLLVHNFFCGIELVR